MNITITDSVVHLHVTDGRVEDLHVGSEPAHFIFGEDRVTGEKFDAGEESVVPLRTEIDNDTIREAITSDPRFTQRSLQAIQKHLSAYAPAAVAAQIAYMLEQCYLTSRRNRAGVTLYSVA